jgi:hypothetical protein
MFAGLYRGMKTQVGLKASRAEAQAAYRKCTLRYQKYPSYEQYHADLSIPHVSTVPQQEWARRFRSLQLGMNEGGAEQIMDRPDYVQCGMNKEGTRFVGSSWNYQVEMNEDDVNYKKNSWIEIFFDAEGKLADKDAVNIQGVPNRPLPQALRD